MECTRATNAGDFRMSEWIEYDGKGCPVYPHQEVCVEFGGGIIIRTRAHCVSWDSHDGNKCVKSYKIVDDEGYSELPPIKREENDLTEIFKSKTEYTGGGVSYYTVRVKNPTKQGRDAYDAECNDIIEALEMDFAEGNAFKAIWRRAAARQGKCKKGYTDGLYDAEKVEFFGARMVAQEKAKCSGNSN